MKNMERSWLIFSIHTLKCVGLTKKDANKINAISERDIARKLLQIEAKVFGLRYFYCK